MIFRYIRCIEYKSILKSDDILSGTGTTFSGALVMFASVGGKFCSTGNLEGSFRDSRKNTI
ncbi:MAG: hypothetical protein Q9M94_04565 [Candidatus Gracilibacteria bacterium]|nr:hypothetical protein [Candidatus Gracilibacteria bacterium]